KSWEKGVLPQMGPRLGIFKSGFVNYPSLKHDFSLDSNFYPASPLLKPDEWQDIVNYFVATSPDSLPAQQRVHPIKTGLPLFTVQIPGNLYQNAATSYIKIVSNDSVNPFIISDAIKQNTYFISNKLQITDSVHTRGGPIVDIDFSQDGMLACNIGVLNPNNGKFGKGQFLRSNSKSKPPQDTSAVINGLQRPVQITSADLNNDGRKDLLVCEFGFLTGSLSWMENTGNNTYHRHVLRALPGAIKAYIEDYNQDGLPDIWVLFAQGEEGIFLFTNKGHGNFDQEEVLRFPAVYGSSYFELADFNKDGYPDIIYTCGDNADYSPVIKPYHGVYIFMNDKTNHFVQKFFFPINGCYKAMARDFDNDGDLDIAAISFFPDYMRQPEESFVYLKNMGNFDFLPYTLPEGHSGRWLVMDVGDIDGDGKIDITLGNFSLKPALNRTNDEWKKLPPFIILKNTGK
ncbi:MAG: VCBS repeat-containing protein, partial [Ferruginibacter sp.]